MKFGIFGGAISSAQDRDGKAGTVGYTVDSSSHHAFVENVIAAERLGFHSILVVEHHFAGVGQLSPLQVLCYLAGRTSRIRLGTAVSVLPWHNPIVLSEQVATLDVLSGGRVDFGVGKGYRQAEFDGFCVPIGESHARFEEAMEIIRKAWNSTGRFSHHGTYWNYENIQSEPRPVQQPHPPFWQGVGSEGSIRNAARQGFNILLDQLSSIATTIERVAIFRDECDRAGRHYEPGMVGVTRNLSIVKDDAERRAAIHERRASMQRLASLARGKDSERLAGAGSMSDADIEKDDSALLGSPEEIVARLRQLQAGGVDYVLLTQKGLWGQGMHTFAAEIAPAFQTAAPVTAKIA